jgi:hypothetical protein
MEDSWTAHFSALKVGFAAYNESYLRGSFRCNAGKPGSLLQNQFGS